MLINYKIKQNPNLSSKFLKDPRNKQVELHRSCVLLSLYVKPSILFPALFDSPSSLYAAVLEMFSQ